MTARLLWAKLGSSFGDNGSAYKPMESRVAPISPPPPPLFIPPGGGGGHFGP